jgi:hypothetical protein
MDLLFAADSPWVWDAEENFQRLREESPNIVRAARRADVDPENVYEDKDSPDVSHVETALKGNGL